MSAGEPRTGLSAVRNQETEAWWSFAADTEEQARAPEFLLPVLRGDIKRVPASREQIEEALRWAAELPGWEPIRGLKPLHVYSAD